MKRRILTASAVVLVAAVVLVVLVVVRLDACWGFGAGGSGTSVAETASPGEDTAEYWTKERLESATNSPMPSC